MSARAAAPMIRIRRDGADLAASLGASLAALHRTLWRWAEGEAARAALWIPVLLAAGIAAYFSLQAEPSPIVGPIGAALFSAVALTVRRVRLLAFAAAFFCLGFALAERRASSMDGPGLRQGLGVRFVIGRMISVEEGDGTQRALIEVRAVEGLDQPPRRLLLAWRRAPFAAGPGDLVRFRAVLRPPPGPDTPGGFDYARSLYFQNIGALGLAVTPPLRLAETSPPLAARFSRAVERLRLTLARRIVHAAPGEGGALVAASITGKNVRVATTLRAALRDSGLAHLIAISGLNMALATGMIFFAVRAGLAAIPPLALRIDAKKWAAGAALAAGLFYLFISGAEWSATRAFIMAAVVYLSVLFDRRAVSLRNVALAAVIILVLSPEAAVEPGFQMSFAATAALVAAFEWARGRFPRDPDATWIRRGWRWLGGLVATDLVASSATGPFSVYHFHRVALFGLPANIIAGPAVAFLVMPLAVIALLLIPFGLDGSFWRLAALGGDVVAAVARKVAANPHAVMTVAPPPAAAVAVAALGEATLILLARPWRLAGAGLMALGVALGAVAPEPPDLFIAADGVNAALVLQKGEGLALVRPNKDKFAAREWLAAAGVDPARGARINLRLAADCASGLCVVERRGARLALASNANAIAAACAGDYALVVALGAPPAACAKPILAPDPSRLSGVRTVTIGADGEIRIKSVGETRGARRWTPRLVYE